MRHLHIGILLLTLGILVSGCARYPVDQVPKDVPPRTIYSQITVRGQIRPYYYYFFALGTDQTGATGPVPVVTGPELTNGWGTISGLPSGEVEEPPFYVRYHDGRFEQFRNGVSLGLPYDSGVSGNTIWVEIDQRLLAPLLPANATSPTVQLNWMTMEVITIPLEQVGLGKQYDGFGRTGNDFIKTLPLLTPLRRISGVDGVPVEPPYGDPPQQPEVTAPDADIDMTAWQVEVRVLQ